VRNLYLEGADWDFKKSCLCESVPLKFISNLPVIHFKPIVSAKIAKSTVFKYPCIFVCFIYFTFLHIFRFLPMPYILLSFEEWRWKRIIYNHDVPS